MNTVTTAQRRADEERLIKIIKSDGPTEDDIVFLQVLKRRVPFTMRSTINLAIEECKKVIAEGAPR